ncbi:MAG: hypothetical protein KGO92_09410 [Bacteroidota bacterium]|nr:hypothetical protein [Bacteroidota bacterium]
MELEITGKMSKCLGFILSFWEKTGQNPPKTIEIKQKDRTSIWGYIVLKAVI